MGLYIKGMEMPELEIGKAIKMEIRNDNGVVSIGMMTGGYPCCEEWTYYEASKIPEPHGRLVEFIDVVTYEEDGKVEVINFGEAYKAYCMMRAAKPVIEAEGE